MSCNFSHLSSKFIYPKPLLDLHCITDRHFEVNISKYNSLPTLQPVPQLEFSIHDIANQPIC